MISFLKKKTLIRIIRSDYICFIYVLTISPILLCTLFFACKSAKLSRNNDILFGVSSSGEQTYLTTCQINSLLHWFYRIEDVWLKSQYRSIENWLFDAEQITFVFAKLNFIRSSFFAANNNKTRASFSKVNGSGGKIALANKSV